MADDDSKPKRAKRPSKDDVIAELTQSLRLAREELVECQERCRVLTEQADEAKRSLAARARRR